MKGNLIMTQRQSINTIAYNERYYIGTNNCTVEIILHHLG